MIQQDATTSESHTELTEFAPVQVSGGTLPRLHQVVWCRLPEGDGQTPGRSVRPALVRGSKHNPTTRRGALLVSHGTTKLDSKNCAAVDLIIQNAQRLYDLKLPMAVRFDLGLTNWLPWCREFFAPPDHYPYIIAGSLSEAERARLRDMLKRRGIIQEL